MSRSNVPANQPGSWPPQALGPGEFEPRDTTGRPAQRHPGQPQPGQPYPGQPQQPRQPLPQGYAPAHPAPGAYPQQAQPQQQPAYAPAPNYPAYPDPQSPYANPGPQARAGFPQPRSPSFADTPPTAGRQAPAAPQGGPNLGAAPSYLPQFDPYVPPAQPSAFTQLSAPAQPQAAPYAPQNFGRAGGFEPQMHVPQQHTAQNSAPQFGQRAVPPQQFPAAQDALSQLSSPRVQRAPEPQFAPPQQLAQPQQPGFEGWRQPSAAQLAPAAPQTGPHGFDLGGFLPSEPTGGRRAGAPQPQQPAPSLNPPGDLNFGEWPRPQQAFDAQQPYGQGNTNLHGGFDAEPSLDANYGAEYDAQQGGEFEQAHEVEAEDDGYDYEEPKKRSNLMLVGGALVAAVIVGSGLAFVYQKFMPAGGVQSAALVKSDGAPAKVKPAEPGGKQFSHTDSKVMGRLSDNGMPITTSSTAAGDADPNGPRKVATIPVGRDGSLAAPMPSPTPEGPPQASVSVPGMTIVDGFGNRPRQGAAVAAIPAPPQQPVVVTPPATTSVKPVVTARAAPAATASATDADLSIGDTPDAPAAPVKKAVTPKKKVVDAYGAAGTPPAAAPVTTASTGGSGFIPVLASVPASGKSRMEALKQFADMQQKYGAVLSDKTPDVQEANLGEKGTYHRLLAGPPGSREQATQVCGQLKAAGYNGCWVTAY